MDKAVNILIVEDCQDDVELYMRTIRQAINCNFYRCASAEEAQELLLEDNDYDVLLLDYNLPGMNGDQFLEEIRSKKLLNDCAIIALTGQGSERTAVNFMQLGICDYVIKGTISKAYNDNVALNPLNAAIVSAMTKKQQEKQAESRNKELLLFAQTLAHDLKNPIGRIRGYCKLLRKASADKVSHYSQAIEEDANFLSYFIEQLLYAAEYGRHEMPKKKTSIMEVVGQSIRNLEALITEKRATIHLPKELPTVMGSPICLVRLFQNLMANSIKYCEKQPVITIEAKLLQEEVRLSLTDNGIGIPQDECKDVFAPFKRGNKTLDESGLGLGLSIVKTICDQHDASIEVMPAEGGGTVFSIMFPR